MKCKEKIMETTHSDAFFTLSQLEDEQVELSLGALLIAKDAYPELDIDTYVQHLNQMGEEAHAQIGKTTDSGAQIAGLNHYLFEIQGFSGNQDDYYNPQNSYLNDVLERKLGIPITLSIVYIEVGRRLGLSLFGVGFPGHFLVKHKGEYLETFIDPFEGGQILTETALADKLEKLFQQPVSMQPEFIRELTNKEILARVLRNLKQLYFKQKEYQQAIRVGERITWLQPDFAQDYRDLGYLYYQVESYGQSLTAFQKYLNLADHPPDEQEIERNIQVVTQQVARLN
jgi:regulator of sirC expression with transglutaminase-like and TPR domain